MLGIYYIYYSYLWYYVHNENNGGVTIIVIIFMYNDDYNWRAKCCHYEIKEIDSGFGRYG